MGSPLDTVCPTLESDMDTTLCMLLLTVSTPAIMVSAPMSTDLLCPAVGRRGRLMLMPVLLSPLDTVDTVCPMLATSDTLESDTESPIPCMLLLPLPPVPSTPAWWVSALTTSELLFPAGGRGKPKLMPMLMLLLLSPDCLMLDSDMPDLATMVLLLLLPPLLLLLLLLLLPPPLLLSPRPWWEPLTCPTLSMEWLTHTSGPCTPAMSECAPTTWASRCLAKRHS